MQYYFLASEPAPDGDSSVDPSGGGAPSRGASAGPLRRFVTSGEDPEQARRAFGDAYEGARFTVSRGEEHFSFRYASVGDDRITLRTATITGHVSGEVPGLDEYVVTWFQSGGGRIQRRDAAVVELPQAPFLLPFQQRYTFTLTPHRQNSVHVARHFLEDIATEIHGGPHRPVAFDGDARPASDRIARWRAAVVGASDVLLDVDGPPLLRMNAQRSVARALLDLAPWAAFDVPPVLREPSMARTRLALEYLHHHAHEPITTADAARAAGLHTRTLQHHLSRHLGTSPTLYLRDIRLDRARADLAEQTPDDTTVAAVARAWGFGHLGRFSAAYRVRFGERPNETLRR